MQELIKDLETVMSILEPTSDLFRSMEQIKAMLQGNEILGRLKRIDTLYKEYLKGGANNIEAAEGSIEEVLGSCPYIHQDDDGFPTHFFYNNYVYFFGGGIYKAI